MRLLRRPAATPRIPFVLSLHSPVDLRSPNQQHKPDRHAEQADDGTEADDSGHISITAGPNTSRGGRWVDRSPCIVSVRMTRTRLRREWDPRVRGWGMPSASWGGFCSESTQHTDGGNGQVAELVPRFGTRLGLLSSPAVTKSIPAGSSGQPAWTKRQNGATDGATGVPAPEAGRKYPPRFL